MITRNASWRRACTALAALALTDPAAPSQAEPPPPCVLVQTAELRRDTAGGFFGGQLALHSDRAAVLKGSINEVFVFERTSVPGSSPSWAQVAVLANGSSFGEELAIFGDTLVVGAPGESTDPTPIDEVDSSVSSHGAVLVHERDAGGPGAWGEVQRIELSPLVEGARLGSALVFDGPDTVLIGEQGGYHGDADTGLVHVFERDAGGPGVWAATQLLAAPGGAAGDDFGAQLAIDGDRLLVAAQNAPPDGLVHLFERTGPGQSWSAVRKLRPPEPGFGFGYRLALAGDVAAVTQLLSYKVFVFRGLGGLVQHEATLTSSLAGFPVHGAGLGFVGDQLAVGDFTSTEGYVELYAHEQGAWNAVARFTGSDSEPFDRFGRSLATDGSRLLVGADNHFHEPASQWGAAYLFELTEGLPGEPVSYCTAGTSGSGCQAVLCAGGSASASADQGFALSAADVEGAVAGGLFFFGVNGRQAMPWGNGTSFRCVAPPTQRTGVLTGGGSSGQCDGRFFRDLNATWCPTCLSPQKNPGAGAVVQAQLWYRDPQNTSNRTTSLSNAVEFDVLP